MLNTLSPGLGDPSLASDGNGGASMMHHDFHKLSVQAKPTTPPLPPWGGPVVRPLPMLGEWFPGTAPATDGLPLDVSLQPALQRVYDDFSQLCQHSLLLFLLLRSSLPSTLPCANCCYIQGPTAPTTSRLPQRG